MNARMTRIRFVLLLATALLTAPLLASAQRASGSPLPDGFRRVELELDGTRREALVYAPADAVTKDTPVVFAFHGHGGSMQQAVRSFALHREWPQAISVYMQGLNTPGRLTDPEGKKPGWQSGPGSQGDRDLRFFDALLAKLRKDFKVDGKRVYAMGHSNGGAFTYLLWLTRPGIFAAFAPSGALLREAAQLKPKPAMHIAGDNDPLVKFQWQKLSIDAVRQVNGCGETGVPWEKVCTLYPSASGAPFVTYIQSGGHKFPPDAPALIVKFFRQHPAAAP